MTAITGYHAHVYYDAETKSKAETLRQDIDSNFDTTLGRWHDRPVGPHPQWSYQIAFSPDLFATLIPWLALNRNGLTIFVHPQTGDDLADHRDFPIWLGQSDTLKLDMFHRSGR